MKAKQAQKVLTANLRLLVLLRETLAAQGETDAPLYKAIADQAQLTGAILPNDARLTENEVKAIRKQALAATALETLPERPQAGKPVLPGPGNLIVLTPDQLTGGGGI